MELKNVSVSTSIDKEESDRLNLEGKALDSEWLFSKVSEGCLTLDAYTQLFAIRDLLQHTYPDNWDLQIIVHKTIAVLHYEQLRPLEEIDPAPYGCYFGFENRSRDDEQYYNWYNSTRDKLEYLTERREEEKVVYHYTFRVIVKFPELVISNSEERTHRIRDLYFSFILESALVFTNISYIDEDSVSDITYDARTGDSQLYSIPDCHLTYVLRRYKIKNTLYGARETVTTVEFNNGYAHSHIPGRSRETFTSWATCCLGHGEIGQTFVILMNEFSPELFQLFLLQLDAYARWESIEGGPHNRMSNIQAGDKLDRYPIIKENKAGSYFGHLKNYIKQNINLAMLEDREYIPDLDWKIENNKLSIIDNDKFDKFCKINRDIQAGIYAGIAFYTDNQGSIYSREVGGVNIIPHLPQNERYFFIFQRRKVVLRVIAPLEGVTFSENFILHPTVKQYIKQKLENYANQSKIRANTVKRANRLNNIPTDIR